MAYFRNADEHNKLKRINFLASNYHVVGALEKFREKFRRYTRPSNREKQKLDDTSQALTS
jgi:hypothetical protein